MDHDIIGDIHGYADKLTALLRLLGYRETQGAWRHPDRTAGFVGDFIDRGAQGVETVNIVRKMCDAGSAQAVMGNHELNAAAWHTPDRARPGEYLRPRHTQPWGAKNRHQHAAYLAQVEHDPALHADQVGWFLTLPLWLDLPGIRVVHACWHQGHIDWLTPRLRDGRYLSLDLLPAATTRPEQDDTAAAGALSVFTAVEVLTKGIEVALPPPHHFHDKDGIRREAVRTRWWDPQATTFRSAALLPSGDAEQLPEVTLPGHAQLEHGAQKPVFFGHYWMSGTPRVLGPAAACVDYSAGKGGPLVAYRWEAGAPLAASNFWSAGS